MGKGDRQALLNARRELDKQYNQLLSATGYLLEPLKSLNEEQAHAVTMLTLLVQTFMLAERPQLQVSAEVRDRFQRVIVDICPPLGKVVITGDPCFDATVSYLSAVKECEDEGKTEAECPDSWGPAGQSVACIMEYIESRKIVIENLLEDIGRPPPEIW